jgi:hypothetical protein
MMGGKAGASGMPPATAASADLLLSKPGLHALADRLLVDEAEAVERCVAFVLVESRGFWHNRARAMMCRRLKHCSLSAAQRAALVACIGARLAAGTFSEQFKDQLRLALHLDLAATRRVAAAGLDSPAAHVRRHAAWVLSAEHLRDRPSMV